MLRIFGDPYGNRTHDLALRGPRLNRLTKGPLKLFLYIYIIFLLFRQLFWEIFVFFLNSISYNTNLHKRRVKFSNPTLLHIFFLYHCMLFYPISNFSNILLITNRLQIHLNIDNTCLDRCHSIIFTNFKVTCKHPVSNLFYSFHKF